MNTALHFRGDVDASRFTDWLADLKQVGSNILVTGEVPDRVSARASRAFFGREERRFRILALTDKTITNADARLPEEASFDDPTTWVVDQRYGERSVPATATSVTSDLDSLGTDDATELGDEIRAAIDFYETKVDGFDPAELRVGVDSLSPLVQRNPTATKQTLETLRTAVRSVQGMAHYHLRVPHDDEVVDELMPEFDARVELRKRPRRMPEQRWYAPSLDARTPWMEL